MTEPERGRIYVRLGWFDVLLGVFLTGHLLGKNPVAIPYSLAFVACGFFLALRKTGQLRTRIVLLARALLYIPLLLGFVYAVGEAVSGVAETTVPEAIFDFVATIIFGLNVGISIFLYRRFSTTA